MHFIFYPVSSFFFIFIWRNSDGFILFFTSNSNMISQSFSFLFKPSGHYIFQPSILDGTQLRQNYLILNLKSLIYPAFDPFLSKYVNLLFSTGYIFLFLWLARITIDRRYYDDVYDLFQVVLFIFYLNAACNI